MNAEIKQISSLEKIRSNEKFSESEIFYKKALRGERVSYQIVISGEDKMVVSAKAQSPFGDGVKLFREREVYVDMPLTETNLTDEENYIMREPGFLPDVLIPLEEDGGRMIVAGKNEVIWVRVDVPYDMPSGVHKVRINFEIRKLSNKLVEAEEFFKEFEIEVIDSKVAPQSLIYTRWFYADCIADIHGVEIYSEKHWELIEKYMLAAKDSGVNMLLVPVHTPPLDTEIGTQRPCVQLVDIEKRGDEYIFGFEKFYRYIALCQKCGIEYFEIAHMFSQWGAHHAPNIEVTEKGVKSLMFGWHTDSRGEEYKLFLKQYVSAISKELDALGISEKTYFHISDEPVVEDMEKYAAAKSLIKPYIG